jgi:predicted RNase H-like HicB family nuclease
MSRDRYVFPALFFYAQEGITITFPDLPGCISEAGTDEEALRNAHDALGSRLYADEEDNTPIPEPSRLIDVATQPSERAVLVEVDMLSVRQEIKPIYVKKTLTIPESLNRRATRRGINFSQVLQEALRDKLGAA